MTEADEGDIIHQKKLEIVFADTANTLYQSIRT
jgi:folate-dependent phosphoribosylglycinamide formyltransferase PurN